MKKGFTLLELLISITIFAIITASVYASLHLGIKVIKHEETSDAHFEQAMATFRTMSISLRCAFINPDNEEIKFTGLLDNLDFASINKKGDIETIVFYVESQADKDRRSLFQLKTKLMNKDSEVAPVPELINTNISELQFSYFDADKKKWYDEWPDELVLPQQVRITITFFDTSSKDQVLELTKYVNIPAGCEIDLSGNELL